MSNLPPLEKLLIPSTASLREALALIDSNAQGICFVVNSHSRQMVGIVTDGDIRRTLLRGTSLDESVALASQDHFVSMPLDTSIEDIQRTLSDRIRHIPLVDEHNVPKDYACKHRYHQVPVMTPSLSGNELEYITECVKTSWISSQGKYVRTFEEQLADYCEVPYALAVSNGTVALHLALMSLEIGLGDEIIVPDFTFAATINAVLYAQATPVVVDVDRTSWNIDPKAIRQAITPRTKAIIPVHLYGFPAAMPEIMQIAKEHQLWVIEDAAEALGSKVNGRYVGSWGHASTFSFFGNKTITTGEGGMVLFQQEEHYLRGQLLRDHGMSPEKRYWHETVGYNYRMTNLQAAIGVAQMERVQEIIEKKIHIGERYNKVFAPYSDMIELPPCLEDHVNTYWLYTLLLKAKGRDTLAQKLLMNGIDTRPTFYPLHSMPIYQTYSEGDYPVASKLSAQGLSLPSSVDLSLDEVTHIAAIIAKLVNNRDLTLQ